MNDQPWLGGGSITFLSFLESQVRNKLKQPRYKDY